MAAPLLMAELPAAMAVFPLAFARLAEGKHQLVALLGLEASQNLFVNAQGHWQGAYTPACYRAYPFSLQRVSGEAERMLMCFNEGSGLLRERPDATQGESRFFDDDGKLLKPLQERLAFLETCASNTQQTQAAVDALDAAGLLQAWPRLGGLYRIDEAALAQLSAGQLLALRDAGALPMAYAQLLSLPRLASLQRLLTQRRQAAQQANAPAGAPDLALAEKLFEPGQSDTFQFNW
jgi:hypothetical protein